MRFGSVCSGIEAASVAWHPLGWQAAWLSEIEPFPSAVLAHHYPDTPNLGDMTTLPERIKSGEVEAPDLFCGGTPCQAFSVAGLRNSLDDDRGNLSLKFVEIANAIDNRRQNLGHVPAIIFWENVPGVLSTKDNAFGCFLGALAGENEPVIPAGDKWTNAGCVYGPQRTVAWRVLDAQYFGVAQRRRRVFVVASARDEFDPVKVLFESEGVRRDTAPRRETGKNIASGVESGVDSNGLQRTVGTLCADSHPGAYSGQDAYTGRLIPTPTYAIQGNMIGRNDNAGPQGDGINEEVCFTQNCVDKHAVAYGIPGNWIGRKPENGGNATTPMHDIAPCLTKTDVHGVAQPVAFVQNSRDEVRLMGGDGSIVGALAAETGAKQQCYVAQPIPIDTMNMTPGHSSGGLGFGQPGDPSFTLTKGHSHAVAQPTVLMDQGGSVMNVMQDGTVGTLRRETHGHEPSILQNMAVRRLTPVECERLQGFPDGYTNIPWRKKEESPDGPRYKALGNSWAVPVVRWIGRRIQAAIQ
jgi:DNA (cytosine-5)-methyltransferase 1